MASAETLETKVPPAQSATGRPPYPSTPRAAYGVGMLTLAYILSFFDRQILSLLVQPIKADLLLSDTQIGLLLGFAFAFFYVLMGIPIGWLADRFNRRNIVAIGITLWSIATAACGLARSFPQLFAARLCVGVGEASLGPCAISMITDMFPKKRRARAIAFYTAALPIGLGTAYLIGGKVIEWTAGLTFDVPVIGTISSWQAVFMIMGLPGLFVALIFLLTVKEPRRRSELRPENQGFDGITTSVKYFVSRGAVYLAFLAAPCAMTIIAYSHSWNPTLFDRTWGVSVPDFAWYTGLVFIFIIPFFNIGSGWAADRYREQGQMDGPLKVYIAGFLILTPCAIVFSLMPEPISAFILAKFCTVGIAMISATAPTVLVAILPDAMRAQGVALYYFSISITGSILGPWSVAFFTDSVFMDESMIRYSMAVVAAIFCVPVLFALPTVRRLYLKELEARE